MRVRVCRWASGVIHVADVPEGAPVPVTVFGSEGEALDPPIAALCGAILRGSGVEGTVGNLVIVMRHDQKATCRPCIRYETRVGLAAASIVLGAKENSGG